jgi:hypothetical protein
MFWHRNIGLINPSPVISQLFNFGAHHMDTLTAIEIIEGITDVDNEDIEAQAWQTLIDSGLAWQLQGWYGRTANRLIEIGVCTPPVNS